MGFFLSPFSLWLIGIRQLMSRSYGIKNDSKRKAEESSAIGDIPKGDTLWMKYRFVKISEKISAL
jgi:hypothetical protein